MQKEIDKLALIKIQDGRILSTRSRGKSLFYIPGGKRENGESDAEALKREIQEELSVTILSHTLEYIGTFIAQADGHPNGVQVKMTCYQAHYQGELTPANEIEEIRWLLFSDVDLISEVDKKIFHFLKDQGKLD